MTKPNPTTDAQRACASASPCSQPQTPTLPPNPENSRSVDQNRPPRWQRILQAVYALRPTLARQGAIVASWRAYQGTRLGPYYRLAYRVDGQQRSLYLGACDGLVQLVRTALREIQGRLRESQTVQRLIERAKTALAECKERLGRQLAQLGIVLKGWEMRGVRAAMARAFRPLVSPQVDNPSLPPPPGQFGLHMRPGLRRWLWQTINQRATANAAELLVRGELDVVELVQTPQVEFPPISPDRALTAARGRR